VFQDPKRKRPELLRMQLQHQAAARCRHVLNHRAEPYFAQVRVPAGCVELRKVIKLYLMQQFDYYKQRDLYQQRHNRKTYVK
jgi:hypothetical protein